RRKSGRPLPLAGRPGFGRFARVDRGSKQAHLRLSERDSRTCEDQGAIDQTLELREIHPALQGGWPLLLFQERRPAESERALYIEIARQRTARPARSEQTLDRRHGGLVRLGCQRGRQISGLRAFDLRL